MTLLEHLSKIPDFRRKNKNFRHELVDILVLSVLATLSGAEDYEEIAWFGEQKQGFLAQFLSLPHGIPSHDTIRRVLMHLDPEALNKEFMNWIQEEVADRYQQVSIDGKTLRGSGQGKQKPLHLVSAVASELGLSLGQVRSPAKQNEISTIPQLLDLLYLKGCIVSIDAMGCQKEIAAQIRQKEADYFLAVKGNQGTLREEVANELDRFPLADAYQKYDKNGAQMVEYQVWVSQHLDWIDQRVHWQDLKSLIKVRTHTHRPDQEVVIQDRYYISSVRELTAQHAYELSRQHWSIENQLHWQLDVTFREDDKTIQDPQGGQNMALLRKIALNLIQLDQSIKASKKKKIKKAAWDNKYLMHLFNLRKKHSAFSLRFIPFFLPLKLPFSTKDL